MWCESLWIHLFSYFMVFLGLNVSFPKWEKFAVIISFSKPSSPFSFSSPSGTSVMQMLMYLMLSHTSIRFSSLFFVLLFFLFLWLEEFKMICISVHLYFILLNQICSLVPLMIFQCSYSWNPKFLFACFLIFFNLFVEILILIMHCFSKVNEHLCDNCFELFFK